MQQPSNLYAERIFAERPVEMWSLDDHVDYVSLISENQRVLSNQSKWTKSESNLSASIEEDINFSEDVRPIQNQGIYKITSTASTTGATLELESIETFSAKTEKDFAIGLSIYPDESIGSIRLGYKTGNTKTWSDSFSLNSRTWNVVSNTFKKGSSLMSQSTILIEITYISTTQSYGYITGISAGIRAEEFFGSSVGFFPQAIPNGLPITNAKVTPANPYSLSNSYGYYIVDNDIVSRARNSTIPLVYGSTNSTILSKASNNNPSLVVPGKGFLNSSGAKHIKTFECWLRFNSRANSYRRILGPIGSTDGLYVKGPYMTLKVGDKHESYFAGEWSRPMFIQIIATQNYVKLQVNAEVVVSINIDISQYTLPSSDNDWIGFYAYDDLDGLEVDCIAIYPYVVDEKLAKKRYIYAQAVEVPSFVNTSYGGSSISMDYSFANYDKNHSIPRNTTWKSGKSRNLSVSDTSLSFVDIQYPSWYFGNKTFTTWQSQMTEFCKANGYENDSTVPIRMRPATASFGGLSALSDVYPYISVNDNNELLKYDIDTILVIFKQTNVLDQSYKTLLYIENKLNGGYIEVSANNSIIKYEINGSVIQEESYNVSNLSTAGISLSRMSQYSRDAAEILSTISNVYVYVGGSPKSTPELDKTTTAEIHKIALLSKHDSDLANSQTFVGFYQSGVVPSNYIHFATGKTPTYGISGRYVFGNFEIAISSHGYWFTSIPLSLFRKPVIENGQTRSKISSIQLNVDYPEMKNFFAETAYDTMLQPFGSRFFVSLYSQAYENSLDGLDPTVATKNNVIIPTNFTGNHKYEFVDGTILMLQDLTDEQISSMYLNVYAECWTDDLSNMPLAIRSIDFSAITFDEQSLRPIGTKYGKKVYPFTEASEGSYVSMSNNPFKIYKGISPYLYLTSKTGICLAGNILSPSDEGYVHRGIMTKVNEDLSGQYSVGSMMMAIRYQDREFPTVKTPFLNIEGKIGGKKAYLEFYVESSNNDNTRGHIFCEASFDDSTFAPYNKINYYWNGVMVSKPEVSPEEWGMLSIAFREILDFSNIAGSVEILGKFLVDNISIYQIPQTELVSSISINEWYSLTNGGYADWSAVDDPDGAGPLPENEWFDIYQTNKSEIKVGKQSEIYKAYLGTNKIIVDSDADNNVLVSNCDYFLFTGTSTAKNIIKPV